jgi:methyl-accepting chemotaxis protein
MNIRNLKIGTRLAMGFALVLLLLSVIAGIGMWCLQEVGNATEAMAKRALVKERIAADWLVATSTNSVRTFALVKSSDPEDQKHFQKSITQTSLGITENSKKLLAMLDTAEEKSLYADGVAKRTAYVNLRTAILKLKADGQAEQAAQLTDAKLIQALEAYDASIRNMSLHQKANIDQTIASIDTLYRSGRFSLMILAVVSLVLGVLLSWRLTVGITLPLGQAVKLAETVAAGDLTSHIQVQSKDETGQLMLALKHMNDSLVDIVGQVRQGTDTIATTPGQTRYCRAATPTAGGNRRAGRRRGQGNVLRTTKLRSGRVSP